MGAVPALRVGMYLDEDMTWSPKALRVVSASAYMFLRISVKLTGQYGGYWRGRRIARNISGTLVS